jgi:hypothetical protein
MSLKSAHVPAAFLPPFEAAEPFVERLFGQFSREPDKGTVRVGGERYVLVRCESLYLAWFEAMADAFGEDAARQFIYNTAREIGRSDATAFSERMGVTDGVARLAAGPIHFAHAGWAFVDILDDSAPSPDDSYFLHYRHPNTFESEVVQARTGKVERATCLFSAGYSAGWCSEAFSIEVHGREISCTSCGDDHCEFIMAPSSKLAECEARVRGSWNPA